VASESPALPRPRRFPEPEVALAILAVLTFALVPIRINTIYSGLPAHPLFLHVPVILIPVAGIAALVLAARPQLFARHGVWVGAVTVLALGATDLTIGAGKALRSDLHLGSGGIVFGGAGSQASLVARHAHAADILRLLLIAFTGVLIIAIALYRHADGSSTGIGLADTVLSRARAVAPSLAPLRAVLAVLAIACLYFVFHTGDLGAKAVWQGRLGGGAGAPGGLRRPGAGFPGGGSGIPGQGSGGGSSSAGGY
jgi:hypothetical protein